LGTLRKTGDFATRFELWWSEAPSVDFQINLVYAKVDSIVGLECDIRVRCTDYRSCIISLEIFIRN
jgi:hypothetical protein